MTISLNKTWERTTNTITSTTSNMGASLCLIAAKNAMVASGHWIVLASSDSVNTGVPGAQDLWVDNTDVVGATAGTAHSWIVLGNDSIEAGFAICIDFINADLRTNAVYCTHQGYYTDGTIQNRPTAVGSECTVHSGAWWNQAVSGTIIFRVITLISSDGQCTRIIWVYPPGYTGASKPWIFDRIKNPPSWLTHPYVAAAPLYASTATITSYINFCGPNMAYIYHTKPVTTTYGSIGIVSALGNTVPGRLADPVYGSIPISPVFLVSTDTSVPGFFGELYDIYWLPDNFGDNISLLVGTTLYSPSIYLPTTQFDLGLFNYGCWAFGNNGEGGLY
jgi:hypothetical protein